MLELTNENYAQEVTEAKEPVVIDFWASWCGPCRAMAPVFEAVSKELAGKAKFVKIDTDSQPELATAFHIRSIPTFVVVKDGKPVALTTGVKSKPSFQSWVEGALNV
jgi:thioredoxin